MHMFVNNKFTSVASSSEVKCPLRKSISSCITCAVDKSLSHEWLALQRRSILRLMFSLVVTTTRSSFNSAHSERKFLATVEVLVETDIALQHRFNIVFSVDRQLSQKEENLINNWVERSGFSI